MKRRYRISKFENIIKLIKENVESSCIGTDVIAGFPGETNDLFKESYDYIQNSLLDYLHVFPYSDRRGTKASSRGDKVSPDLKKSRSKALRELGETKKIDFYSKFIGKRLAAISEKNNHARTRNYIDVNIERNEFVEPGNLMDLIIDKIEDGKAYGHYT